MEKMNMEESSPEVKSSRSSLLRTMWVRDAAVGVCGVWCVVCSVAMCDVLLLLWWAGMKSALRTL